MPFWTPSSRKTRFFDPSKKVRKGSLGIKNCILREDGAKKYKTVCLKGFKLGGQKTAFCARMGPKSTKNDA